jgi:hypothetical protein
MLFKNDQMSTKITVDVIKDNIMGGIALNCKELMPYLENFKKEFEKAF